MAGDLLAENRALSDENKELRKQVHELKNQTKDVEAAPVKTCGEDDKHSLQMIKIFEFYKKQNGLYGRDDNDSCSDSPIQMKTFSSEDMMADDIGPL